jgi:hypothetical protein
MQPRTFSDYTPPGHHGSISAKSVSKNGFIWQPQLVFRTLSFSLSLSLSPPCQSATKSTFLPPFSGHGETCAAASLPPPWHSWQLNNLPFAAALYTVPGNIWLELSGTLLLHTDHVRLCR